MNTITVFALRSCFLVDPHGYDPKKSRFSNKDVAKKVKKKVPDNDFFNGKVKEGILEQVVTTPKKTTPKKTTPAKGGADATNK